MWPLTTGATAAGAAPALHSDSNRRPHCGAARAAARLMVPYLREQLQGPGLLPSPIPAPYPPAACCPAHLMCPLMHPLPHLLCHSEMEGETTRPPLCVTACVETIELYTSSLNLRQDMKVGGAAVLVLPGAQGTEPWLPSPSDCNSRAHWLTSADGAVRLWGTPCHLSPSCSAPRS